MLCIGACYARVYIFSKNQPLVEDDDYRQPLSVWVRQHGEQLDGCNGHLHMLRPVNHKLGDRRRKYVTGVEHSITKYHCFKEKS